jgi:UDPglucose--hexose-1-phosphate uridylyltransferase
MEAIGAHEVVIENPSHTVDFEDLDSDQIVRVFDVLKRRVSDLSKDRRFRQVLMFRTSGIGDAEYLPHPRWHVVATPFVPMLIKQELNGARQYYSYKERCVLCDYILDEKRAKSRVIAENAEAAAISPYAARFPYEIWVLPVKHSPDFVKIAPKEASCLGRLLQVVTKALKRLPESRGYVMSVHTAPYRKPKAGAWKTIDLDYHWHIQIHPRIGLLDGLKESGGFHLNPVSPEEAARTISELC